MPLHTTHADIEQRELFRPAAGLISYRVHVEYSDEMNWDWTCLDLVEEVRDPSGRLAYRCVPFDGYRPERPVIAVGLRALIRADVGSSDVMAQIEDAIRADMADRRERAAERQREVA